DGNAYFEQALPPIGCIASRRRLDGCVFMDLVATQNFRSADRLLANPPPQTVGEHPEAGRSATWRACSCGARFPSRTAGTSTRGRRSRIYRVNASWATGPARTTVIDRKSTRLNSSHG